MFTKRLVLLLFIAGFAQSVYISDIEVNAGSSKKTLKLEIADRDFNGKDLPSKFNLYDDGEQVEFYHRVLDKSTGEYTIDLGGKGGLKARKGGYEFISFARKGLINLDSDTENGFILNGEINLKKNQKVKLNVSPKLKKEVDKPEKIKKSKRQVPITDYYGRTCALGKKYSFCDVCGKRRAEPNVARVVGGQAATIKSWPSAGLLAIKSTYEANVYNSYCSLTLIDRTTAITAGHCNIKAIDLNNHKVILGLHSFAELTTGFSKYVRVMSIKSFIPYPYYNSSTYFYDIAVLKFFTEVDYSAYIQPACLPPPSLPDPTEDQRAWVVGYGAVTNEGDNPDYLQNVVVTYYASASGKCHNYGPIFEPSIHICAGNYEEGGVDSCYGDSGGPIYIKDETLNTYVVVGSTAYGSDCGRAEYPGVYTRFQPYLDWIVSKM